MIHATPRGGELLEFHAERTAVYMARLDANFAALLAKRGREAVQEGADLGAFNGEDGFAAFLATAGSGLKHETRTEDTFRSAVDRLARVAAHAAGKT